MAQKSKSEKVPAHMQAVFTAITAQTDAVCAKSLNEEYAHVARQVTAALCRKRASPLLTGTVSGWACGIVYAVGYVNFLFDKSSTPYLSADELCKQFGVSKSTGAAKAKVVRDALKMVQLDPNWCLPSLLNDNPLAWYIEVNGLIVDARQLPREVQEIAFKKGLIPYIPADQEKG